MKKEVKMYINTLISNIMMPTEIQGIYKCIGAIIYYAYRQKSEIGER